MDRLSRIIAQALKEDIGKGDLTSSLVIPGDYDAEAVIIAREKGILCGTDVARAIFNRVDKRIDIKGRFKDGSLLKSGRVIMNIEGPARGILTAERTVLNFLGRLSGIATLTHQFVTKIKPYKAKIMDTRKTTPGLRYLEKYAVKVGGGFNHRMGLWDGVLIKDNHIKVTSYKLQVISLKELIEKIKSKISKGMSIEVEVSSINEFKDAIEAGADIIMLDNMSVKDIREAVRIKNSSLITHNSQLKLEVSGGVTLANVRQIASIGVDRISVGALSHSAKWLDFALEII